MEFPLRRYHPLLVFLSVLYITSFGTAAYVCVPDEGDYKVYFHKNISIPAKCLCGLCCADVNGDFVIRRLPSFGSKEIKENVRVKEWIFNNIKVVRSVFVRRGKAYIVYTAVGEGCLKIIEDIPKSAATVDRIRTRGYFTKIDPVLVIFLEVNEGSPAVAYYTVDGTDSVFWEPSFEFSSCELSLEDVTVRVEGDELKGFFSVEDRGKKVFVPNVRVRIDGSIVVPQYSEGFYHFSKKVSEGRHVVRIEGSADGCPEIEYKEEVYVGGNANILLLFGAFFVGVFIGLALVGSKLGK